MSMCPHACPQGLGFPLVGCPTLAPGAAPTLGSGFLWFLPVHGIRLLDLSFIWQYVQAQCAKHSARGGVPQPSGSVWSSEATSEETSHANSVVKTLGEEGGVLWGRGDVASSPGLGTQGRFSDGVGCTCGRMNRMRKRRLGVLRGYWGCTAACGWRGGSWQW